MCYVQSTSTVSAVTSGTAISSLTGVVPGDGLVCFVVYQSVATKQAISDSSGQKWFLARSVPLTGASISVFIPTTSTAGFSSTHTLTPTWTGGGSAWVYLLEDTNAHFLNYASQVIAAPGAGNTLIGGQNIGVTGGSVYQIALDNTNSAAGYVPARGQFAASFPDISQTDAAIGAWRIVNDPGLVGGGGAPSTLGGTDPGLAPGASDSTGADTYGVLSVGMYPDGSVAGAVGDSSQIVLVKEDVGPEQRTPYPLGMFFNRTPAFVPSTPLAYLSVKTPPWEFYRDTFTGVYSVIESYDQATQVVNSQPYVLRWRKTNRLDPPEEDFQRFNHGVFFQMQRYYTAQLVGYTVETPDFTDHPWLEWVHPPANPESALLPFRRQIVPANPYQIPIMWGQPKPWWVDEEKDTVNRKPDVGVLIPYPRPIPPTITMPDLTGLDLGTAIGIIQGLGLFFLGAVYQDVIYPIPAPNRFNPLGPEPPPPYGTVIGQWPLAGTIVQPLLTQVTLIVSTGRSFISDVDTSSGNIPNTVIGSTQGP